jgi:molybdate transport system substrate-binding protein
MVAARREAGEGEVDLPLSHKSDGSMYAVWVAASLLALATLGRPANALARPTGQVYVAAAANFVYAVDALNAEFTRVAPETRVVTSVSASGNLFAQIKHGAPFHVYLSADTDYPAQLVAAGLADPDTLRTFATGRLVLWSLRPGVDLTDIAALVRSPQTRKLAIAQPATAPYGRAAEVVLEKLGVLREARGKLVIGESITQTTQFIETGGADAGFVALSAVLSPKLAGRGRWVEVPAHWYATVPLDHAVVLTTRGAGNPAARRYVEFLGGDAAKAILRAHGYAVP